MSCKQFQYYIQQIKDKLSLQLLPPGTVQGPAGPHLLHSHGLRRHHRQRLRRGGLHSPQLSPGSGDRVVQHRQLSRPEALHPPADVPEK